MDKIWIILYSISAKHLPKSERCVLFKKLRGFFFRRITGNGGSNINVEKGARFNQWIRLGNNSGLGINCEMNSCSGGEITIGDNVMMGPNVIIYTRNHATSRTDIPMREQGYAVPQPVTIGNDVWIGRNVIILPGVKIGDGCVIGAGAVVSKSIDPYCVAGGVPARILKRRK